MVAVNYGSAARRLGLATIAGVLVLTQTGCLIIGGHSSRGGWFFWPGGLGGLVLVVLVLLLLRR